MWLIIWMCLGLTKDCHIWNMEVTPVTMRGCVEWAEGYMAAWDDPTWRIKHWRCSTNPVPMGIWDGMQVDE